MKKGLLIALLLPCFARSQDIHFSQFFQVPLALNPANIGAFDGDYRVHGVFRQQWRSVTIPYRTFGIGGDAHHLKGVEGLGVGSWIYNDRAGDGQLNTFHIDLGGSYEYALPQLEGHRVRVGVQIGMTNTNLDPTQFQWDAQYNGSVFDPRLGSGETFARDGFSHPDLQLGFVYHYFQNHRISQQVGIALYNLTTPEISFLNSTEVTLDTRLVIHGLLNRPINAFWDIQPMFQFQSQGKFREFNIGGAVRRILYDEFGYVQAIRAGLYYRSADAGYIFVGLDQGDWQFGLSYDVNLSDLVPASNNRGGLEMTVIRIFRTRTRPQKYRVCPSDI